MKEIKFTRPSYFVYPGKFLTWTIYGNGIKIGEIKDGETITISVEQSVVLINFRETMIYSNPILLSAEDESAELILTTYLKGFKMFFIFLLYILTLSSMFVIIRKK